MKNEKSTEMGAIIDSAMDLVINKTMENNMLAANSFMEPKHTLDFRNDLLAIKKVQAFIEYVYAHQPSMFEQAYRYASESVSDNE
jgi:hypothetical protein|tara:strand:+ start:129 stop:383 length:255 start_codon:yes stop_codon:yes gene_type:complete